jgi:hypothetical protein
VNGPELPGGRATLTDDKGVFELTELPAGRYTLSVSKTGFVGLSYGQRRPLQAGTACSCNERPAADRDRFGCRASVLAVTCSTKTGDPMPGVRPGHALPNTRANAIVPPARPDRRRGTFRVWGLNPGDYYVGAVTRNFDFGGRGRQAGRGGGPGQRPRPGRPADAEGGRWWSWPRRVRGSGAHGLNRRR